jgi:hypothetical protein
VRWGQQLKGIQHLWLLHTSSFVLTAEAQ